MEASCLSGESWSYRQEATKWPCINGVLPHSEFLIRSCGGPKTIQAIAFDFSSALKSKIDTFEDATYFGCRTEVNEACWLVFIVLWRLMRGKSQQQTYLGVDLVCYTSQAWCALWHTSAWVLWNDSALSD